jgi:hypothetical protein
MPSGAPWRELCRPESARDLPGDALGLAQKTLVGDADDTPAGRYKLGIPLQIPHPSALAGVRRRTVGFHYEPLIRSDEIALVALDVDDHLRAREVVFVAEGQEHLLELGACAGASCRVNCEH